MTIFKKQEVQTSNDLYEAYKNEISGKVKKNNSSTFSKILKLEILVLGLGLFVMQQNGFSLVLKDLKVVQNNTLPISIQSDEELVVTLSDNDFNRVEIKEEEIVVDNSFVNETYVENDDIRLLIEVLNAEFESNQHSVSQNRIIISQK